MKTMQDRRPNFLFIGPDKSGSTWLYKAMNQHEAVFLPKVKEFFFFDRFYDRGWQWYERYFTDSASHHSVIGEISHDYLFSPVACNRIARDLPSVKLMVCLREPAQRAFSAYLYMLKQGRVTVDFETALHEIEELIDHGRYAKHLRPYLEAFGRQRIHVAVFDDLVADPQRFFNGVCAFLDIPPVPLTMELKSKINPAMQPRSRHIARLSRSIGWRIRRFGMPEVVGRLKEFTLLKKILYNEYASGSKPGMTASARNYIRDNIRSDLKKLDAMLDMDLCCRWDYPA